MTPARPFLVKKKLKFSLSGKCFTSSVSPLCFADQVISPSLVYLKVLYLATALPNLRRACAASYNCSWVCYSNLTSRVFVRLTKDTTYLAGSEGQNLGGTRRCNAGRVSPLVCYLVVQLARQTLREPAGGKK